MLPNLITVECSRCGAWVRPRGLAVHQNGYPCEVTAMQRKMAKRGLAPVWLSWRGIVEAARLPCVEAIGHYVPSLSETSARADRRLYIPTWAVPIVEDASMAAERKMQLLQVMKLDEAVREMLLAVIEAGALDRFVKNYGAVYGLVEVE